VRRDMYNIYKPSLLSLMLHIGGMTTTTGDNQA
jgi:hypothetical protein